MKRYLILLFVLSLALSACTSQNSSEALLGSWTLTSYGPAGAPVPVVEDSGAQLTFNEDGTIAGNSGCNGFGGDYSVEANEITFGQIVSTLMACEDQRMQQEQAVHQVLTDTATFEIEGNTLTLTNNDMVLVFSK